MTRGFDGMRRAFLKVGAALGGGLLVGVRIGGAAPPAGSDERQIFAPNAWVRVGSDGTVTVIIDRSEMGQGVVTSLAMLVAEELEVDIAAVRTEFAPAAPAYANPLAGAQVTGGSTSVRAAWAPLRQAGAAARQMLIAAAAATWGVAPATCRAVEGEVFHPPTGRRLGYGALADKAATQPVPGDPSLKPPSQFRLIGRSVPRLDIPAKVNGGTVFGMDVRLPDMLVALVARCPVFGGRVGRFDADGAEAVPGVRHVFPIESGIAVVADGFWAASRGRDALLIDWREGKKRGLDSAGIRRSLAAAAERRGRVADERGDVDAAFKGAEVVEAVYETPYQAHAPMEPMNCTAYVQDGRCEIWAPTQAQGEALATAARSAGLPVRSVRVHTTFLGGGFGRRLNQDFVAEAVQIAKAVKVPVKLLWTREDDLRHDHYRPANCTRLRAVLDKGGRPLAWFQRAAGPSMALGGVDLPYAIPNIRREVVSYDPGVPTGPWRSVGASQNAFVVESFVDELAHRAGADPFEYRRGLLAGAPRHRAVLELAAAKAGWGRPLPPGRGRGIAVYFSFGSWVAQVAEVSVSKDGPVRVHRVVCAIDCGTTVHPDTVAAQLEGAVVFGLSGAIKGEITIEGGRVVQGNFHDYPLPTLAEMPEVEVHIMPSDRPPGGVGEPGVPPLAPAVANALFAVTGERIRRLPLSASSG